MDAFTVSLAIGLLVSLAITEIVGMTAGGMIVPGYFALSIGRPQDVLVTLLVALATFGVIRFLSKHMIVYGRRRIVLALLFGFLIGAIVRTTMHTFSCPDDAGYFCVIGFIIPGLIALWFDRQGVMGTLGSLSTCTVLVRLSLVVLGMELAI